MRKFIIATSAVCVLGTGTACAEWRGPHPYAHPFHYYHHDRRGIGPGAALGLGLLGGALLGGALAAPVVPAPTYVVPRPYYYPPPVYVPPPCVIGPDGLTYCR